MPEGLPVVDSPLFLLDYDGTLAPIVSRPMEAHPHPEAPALLDALADRHPLWIITGRHLRDLAVLLDRPLPAVGLHGTQRGRIGGDIELLISDEVAEALRALKVQLPDVPGLAVEEKPPSFAVHYRNAPDPEAAARHLETWIKAVPDTLDVIRGKMVVELRPEGFSKGVAVERIAADHPDTTPIYLGDDVTDEDAFAALLGLDRPVLTVKVGDGETRAQHRLPGVDAVIAYLRQYVV